MAIMGSVAQWVWDEKFWLPSNYSWADFKSTGSVPKPQFSDLYIVPALATLILFIRVIFERFIALPFCIYAGIQDVKRPVERNPICEKVFSVTPNPSEDHIEGLAKQLDCSAQKVDRWFRKRRSLVKQSIMKKATETCWRCLLYFVLFVYGCTTLLPTEWFWDSREWVKGYVREQPFTAAFKWYYLIELSFYTSLLFSQFLDHKRKDFWQMFLHHIVTILLIAFSFTIGHFRIGVVIMFLHDASDYWLEAAKITNYMKLQRVCDGIFVIFAIMFYLTRWMYFPFVVLPAMTYTTVEIHGPFPSHSIFAVLLYILQLLHVYWGYLVGRMIYQFTVVGKVEKDTRSEDETSDDEEKEQKAANNIKKKKQ